MKRYKLCKFTIKQEHQICNQYLTPNKDGTWNGTPTIARGRDTSAHVIRCILKHYSIVLRTVSEAITGKACAKWVLDLK